ncbi:retrovirus-related pol polyprotein from transposon TNT 1-94 [Tanacetum coccineum]
MNASPSVNNVVRKVMQVWKPKKVKQVGKAIGKVLNSVGYQWRPTGRIFTLAEQCPLTRLTKPKVVPATQTKNVVQIILWYLDLGYSKHMTGDRSRLKNFVKKFTGTVRLGNDHFGAIMGYGDYVIGDDVVELNKESRGTNLYTISVEDMMKSSLICLLSKASKNKSWLWHRRLNHLNFGTINDLARKDLVRGLPKLKFEKDHLCSACSDVSNGQIVCNLLGTDNPNRSLIHTRHNKIPYELVHDKKHDLTFIRVFGAFYYPTNDSEDLGKLQPTADIGIFVGYAPNNTGRTRTYISDVWTDKFRACVAAGSTILQDNPFAPIDNIPFVNVFALEPSSEASSFGDVSLAESTHVS